MYNFGAGQENYGCKCTHFTHKFGGGFSVHGTEVYQTQLPVTFEYTTQAGSPVCDVSLTQCIYLDLQNLQLVALCSTSLLVRPCQ